MLTSEQQKIFNVRVPKGGYGYYTLYRGVYDPSNNIDERPTYAETGDLFEPYNSSVVYKATRSGGKTTWAIDENVKRQSETGEGGSGSSLPSMTGKNGKVLGVTLDAQDHEQAEWVTPSGGGAEKFVVTLTEDDSGAETVWTADKTVAEIVAADAAGKIVLCKVSPSGGEMPYELPLTTAAEIAGGEGYVFIFTGVIMNASGNGNDSATVYGSYGAGQTNWLVTTTLIPTSTNAPLIVTLTADAQTGNLVGDKTYGEVSAAMLNGQTVTCVGEVAGSDFATQVLSITASGENQYSAFVVTGSLAECSGTSSEYFTITLGN